jgi:RNA polymerase sigma factor for flagellar operon FliA
MRRQDWAPSSLRRKITSISRAFSALEVELGRSATEEEVAAYLNIPLDEMRGVLEKSHTFNIVYFEDMLTSGDAERDLMQFDDQSTSAQVEQIELRDVLGDTIDSLPYNEKTVITLYYYKELTLKEIAAILNVSESRVSQIHSKVLIKLKNKLETAFEG